MTYVRDLRAVRRTASAAVVLLASGAAAVPAARAAVPACPAVPAEILPAPDGWAGWDEKTRYEVRELRREAARVCDALRQAGVETRDGVAALDARLAAGVDVRVESSSADPVHITADGASTSPAADVRLESVAAAAADELIGAKAESIYGDLGETLWFLVGATVAAAVAGVLLGRLLP